MFVCSVASVASAKPAAENKLLINFEKNKKQILAMIKMNKNLSSAFKIHVEFSSKKNFQHITDVHNMDNINSVTNRTYLKCSGFPMFQ
jgi:predicted nucleotidyltransferase